MPAVLSPVTGVVIAVHVASGQRVGAHEELVVVESMKMEIPVASDAPGTVREVLVEVGAQVQEGDRIATIE